MGAREAAEIAFRGTHVIPATPEGAPVSSKPMRYRDSEGDIWETVPGSHGDYLMDEGGGVCSYGYVLSQYGPLTLVHDDEPAEEAEDTPVVGEVYESPEELAAEVVRLREEAVRAYSRGVEDMREAAMKAASDAPGTPYTPTEAIRDVTLTGTSADTPAPRDSDLTRTLRDAMKRYGVPAVMAEAGRLAQQRL